MHALTTILFSILLLGSIGGLGAFVWGNRHKIVDALIGHRG